MSTKEKTSPEYFLGGPVCISGPLHRSRDCFRASHFPGCGTSLGILERTEPLCQYHSKRHANTINLHSSADVVLSDLFRDNRSLKSTQGSMPLKMGESQRRKPFTQNALLDHVAILKQFLIRTNENNYSDIPEKKIHSAMNQKNTLTKTTA